MANRAPTLQRGLPAFFTHAKRANISLGRQPRSLMLCRAHFIHTLKTQSRSSSTSGDKDQPLPSSSPAGPAPLSILPLATVLRSLMTMTISSSRILLPPSLAIMNVLANSHSAILNPDKNPILHFFLKKTFYAQFCAGENPQEVQKTIHHLKSIGFRGVILGYAKEVVLEEKEAKGLSSESSEALTSIAQGEISAWADGTMQTVLLTEPGDFVALKFTGAGRQALYNLAERQLPSPPLAEAIDKICSLAVSRDVRLLFDAEQQALQPGIDDWTLLYMRKYNTPTAATIYGTYQAYLKATPQTVSKHLRAAQEGNFTLGVKLVRGAYLGSDPRHLIHDTKEDTDAAYDGIARALLRREWLPPLLPGDKAAEFPKVNVVIASHNADSVHRARNILASGDARTSEVAFAQLQGMADEVSCELVCGQKKDGASVHAYKYLVWGSAGECMKYLLRRAQENRDAVQRTKTGRDAMLSEVWRRLRAGAWSGGK